MARLNEQKATMTATFPNGNTVTFAGPVKWVMKQAARAHYENVGEMIAPANFGKVWFDRAHRTDRRRTAPNVLYSECWLIS